MRATPGVRRRSRYPATRPRYRAATRRSKPGRIEWRPLTRDAGASVPWAPYRGVIPADRDAVVRLSLRISGTGRLGRLSFREAGASPAPAPVRGLAVRTVGGGTDVELTWTLRSGATAYDVFQGDLWLGRTHRDAFFSPAVDLASGRTFSVVPISAAGIRGAAAQATLA